MPLFVKASEFFNSTGLDDFGVSPVKDAHHLLKRFCEFSGRVSRRVLPFGYEVVDPHRIVFVRVNKRQMNRDRISWSPILAVIVSHNEKISEPVHALVFEGGMKIGKGLKQIVIAISFSLEAILQEDPASAAEVLLVKLPAISVEKNMAMFFRLLAKSLCKFLCFSKAYVNQYRRMGFMLPVALEGIRGAHILL